MPTYEYDCKACGHEFERFQKMSDHAVTVCPECGKPDVVRRISSGGGILFKGPGFYATDYRKALPPTEKRSESGSAGEVRSDSSKGSGSGGSGGGSKDSESRSTDPKGGSKE